MTQSITTPLTSCGISQNQVVESHKAGVVNVKSFRQVSDQVIDTNNMVKDGTTPEDSPVDDQSCDKGLLHGVMFVMKMKSSNIFKSTLH